MKEAARIVSTGEAAGTGLDLWATTYIGEDTRTRGASESEARKTGLRTSMIPLTQVTQSELTGETEATDKGMLEPDQDEVVIATETDKAQEGIREGAKRTSGARTRGNVMSIGPKGVKAEPGFGKRQDN